MKCNYCTCNCCRNSECESCATCDENSKHFQDYKCDGYIDPKDDPDYIKN